MAFITEFDSMTATADCARARPCAQPGLHALVAGVNVMVKDHVMTFVEVYLLSLGEKSRRLLSHYGAVNGCFAGHEWREMSYDANNLIYASVWEYWKGEEHYLGCPTCRNITNCKSAGNILEALLGAAWLHLHHPSAQALDAIYVTDAHQEEARAFVRTWGSLCAFIAPVLEHAIIGMQEIWKACPWIQTTKHAYNRELMQTHLEALRLGFPSGFPFYIRKLPVYPVELHRLKYPEDELRGLHNELQGLEMKYQC